MVTFFDSELPAFELTADRVAVVGDKDVLRRYG